jgi:urease accessory protein
VTTSRLLPLLHLCDSLFPVGAFAHSDGLEWATDAHRVVNTADLGGWMDGCLDQTIGQCDGPAIWHAWNACAAADWAALTAINVDVHALRPSASTREAIRAMGARLIRTWNLLYAPPGLLRLAAAVDVERTMTLPAAFAGVCAAEGIERRAALAAYIYTRLSAVASAAMRLMPIGQHEAHRVLAARLRRVDAVVDAIASSERRPGSFTPAMDIAAMSHQYVHSRLFRS